MIRRTFLGLLLVSACLSGCSFAPVYGEPSLASSWSFAYAAPNSRLEQIIYQRLALSFPASPVATPLAITASASARGFGKTDRSDPYEQTEVTVSATATIIRYGQAPILISRQATAIYARANQVLASQSARADAEERAAEAAAESLRIALLALAPQSGS